MSTGLLFQLIKLFMCLYDMKFSIIVFTILLFLHSCSKTDRLTQVLVGEEFTMRVGARLDLEDSARFLAEIKILDINDSRCPANVQCIRAGEALVTIGLTGINDKLVTQTLCNGDCPMTGSIGTLKDTVTVNLDDLLVTLILVKVEPYPSLDDGDHIKMATIIFERYTDIVQ